MASNQLVTSSRDTSFPVFAGSEVLAFSVSQMPPLTKIYSYVNGVNITAFTAPVTNGALMGDTIETDQLGSALGLLYIPSTDGKYKFLTGEIRITFSDSPNGVENSKYISETTLYNHGISLVDVEQGTTVSLRSTERFRTDVAGSSSETSTSLKQLSPLSQTFLVDQAKHPLGIVLTGINLFFFSKDDKLPIGIELRPVVDGKPSTLEYMSGSYVQKLPADVTIYDQATGSAPATVFTFQHPIFLKPGDYAFCVITKSDKYQLLSAKVGDGKTVKQPFAGSLFKAQNTGEWIGDTNEDLTFVLRKAKFETGTATFEMQNPDLYPIDYNRLRLLTTDINYGTTAYADYRVQTTNSGGSVNDYKTILQNSELNLDGRQTANAQGDLKVEISLTTKSEDVAPILDKQLIKAQVFKNSVVPYTQEISQSELAPNNGSARSRYISKIVTLQEGFDSTGIEVKVDVNRKVGTEVEVFYRVLSREDKLPDRGIFDRPWILLPLVSPSRKSFAGTSDDVFTTEVYRTLNTTYGYSTNSILSGTSTDASFEDFAYYQVKVVFYANNPVYLPKIKNLVAVALL